MKPRKDTKTSSKIGLWFQIGSFAVGVARLILEAAK